jgi:beta-lactamase regulating signal transducer with metallopeptidase domain
VQDPAVRISKDFAGIWQRIEPGILLMWMAGSISALFWSLLRVYRFNRLLNMESRPASPQFLQVARDLARKLELVSCPPIQTTSANISPMVWWCGQGVRIVIPDALLKGMDERELKCVVAHELAHVRRLDYLVRWLEWLACVCFWWNPLVWWGRKHLRANEKICCDALVVERLSPRRRVYASSLL